MGGKKSHTFLDFMLNFHNGGELFLFAFHGFIFGICLVQSWQTDTKPRSKIGRLNSEGVIIQMEPSVRGVSRDKGECGE